MDIQKRTKSKTISRQKNTQLQKQTFEKISFDEMGTYEKVRKGKNRQEVWIWTAVLEDKNKKLKKLMFVGDRDEGTFLKDNE